MDLDYPFINLTKCPLNFEKGTPEVPNLFFLSCWLKEVILIVSLFLSLFISERVGVSLDSDHSSELIVPHYL